MAVEPVGGLARGRVGGLAQGDDQSLPVVSVIVPVFNGERTIGSCLESLLAQEYPRDRFEIIAVDNHSRDRTAEIVRRYPVTYVLEDRVQSSYAARNAGIRVARGDILAFTDADCVASPQWVRCAVAAFSDHSVGGVAGELRSTPPRTPAQRYCAARHTVTQRVGLEHTFRPYAQAGNVLYRRRVFDQIGLFDVSLISGGDVDLSWRMLELPGTRLQFVPEALVYYVHRETLKGLLKQRAAYGYGSVLLYRKYRDQLGRRTLKHTYWEARSFGRRVGRLAKLCAQRVVSWNGHEATDAPPSHEALGILVFLARKAGQVKGSIKHRVWYV